MTDTSIIGIIISKFSFGHKLCSLVLLKIDEYLQICLYCTIFLFGLAVGLRVEGGEELLFNIKKVVY